MAPQHLSLGSSDTAAHTPPEARVVFDGSTSEASGDSSGGDHAYADGLPPAQPRRVLPPLQPLVPFDSVVFPTQSSLDFDDIDTLVVSGSDTHQPGTSPFQTPSKLSLGYGLMTPSEGVYAHDISEFPSLSTLSMPYVAAVGAPGNASRVARSSATLFGAHDAPPLVLDAGYTADDATAELSGEWARVAMQRRNAPRLHSVVFAAPTKTPQLKRPRLAKENAVAAMNAAVSAASSGNEAEARGHERETGKYKAKDKSKPRVRP